MFIVHAILLILSGNNPARYFRMVWPVLTFAFVSRSSAASIPLAISAQKIWRTAPLPIFPPRLAPVWGKMAAPGFIRLLW